MVKKAA